MIEFITENLILLAGIALSLVLAVTVVIIIAKAKKGKKDNLDERDIFIDAPAVPIKEKPTARSVEKKNKKADLAWLKEIK